MGSDVTAKAGGDAPQPEYEWERHGALYSRTLDVDPLYQKRTVYWYDSDTREQFLTEHWDGAEIKRLVDANKALYAATDERARMTPRRDGGEMQWTRVFSVPLAIVPEILKKTHNGKDRVAVSRWLTDPENRHFMTRPLRYGV